MDFEFTEEQKQIRALAREFAQKKSRRLRRNMTRAASFRARPFVRWANSV